MPNLGSHIMPNYTEFMMRHGEFGIQAIIERIERQEGVVSNSDRPLEERWEALMQNQRVAA